MNSALKPRKTGARTALSAIFQRAGCVLVQGGARGATRPTLDQMMRQHSLFYTASVLAGLLALAMGCRTVSGALKTAATWPPIAENLPEWINQ